MAHVWEHPFKSKSVIMTNVNKMTLKELAEKGGTEIVLCTNTYLPIIGGELVRPGKRIKHP